MGDTARPAASEGCSVQPNTRRPERPHPRTVVAKQGDARKAEGDPLPCKEDGGAESPHRLHFRAVRVPGIQPGPQVACHHHLGETWARSLFSVRTQACSLCKARVLQCTIPVHEAQMALPQAPRARRGHTHDAVAGSMARPPCPGPPPLASQLSLHYVHLLVAINI